MSQSPTPDDVREAVERVLQQGEFRGGGHWLWDGVRWLFEALPEWSAGNSGEARVLVAVLVVVLLALLAHVAFTIVGELGSYRRPGPTGLPGAGRRPLQALDEVGAENWAEAIGMARTALAAGDGYRVLWIAHRVLLSVLDRAGLVEFARWKTNGDYLSECDPRADASSALAEVTSAYERVVYGHRDVAEAEADRLLARVEALARDAGR